jgi:signal peptidase II
VFNVADSCIVCGGVLAVLLAARGISLEGRQAARPDSAGAAIETSEQGHGHGSGPGIGETPPGPRTTALDATTPVPDRPAAPRTSSDGPS